MLTFSVPLLNLKGWQNCFVKSLDLLTKKQTRTKVYALYFIRFFGNILHTSPLAWIAVMSS